MLTLKVVKEGGSEDLFCGERISYNAIRHAIEIPGTDIRICINPGQVAYVMNSDGKTISKYDGAVPNQTVQVNDAMGDRRVAMQRI